MVNNKTALSANHTNYTNQVFLLIMFARTAHVIRNITLHWQSLSCPSVFTLFFKSSTLFRFDVFENTLLHFVWCFPMALWNIKIPDINRRINYRHMLLRNLSAAYQYVHDGAHRSERWYWKHWCLNWPFQNIVKQYWSRADRNTTIAYLATNRHIIWAWREKKHWFIAECFLFVF